MLTAAGPCSALGLSAVAAKALPLAAATAVGLACLGAHTYVARGDELTVRVADYCAHTGIHQRVLTATEAHSYLLAAIIATRCLRHPEWADGVVTEYALNPAAPTVRLFSCFPISR